MLTPHLYHCPEKLKGILHYDEDGNYYFVFGNKCISIDVIKIIVENSGSLTTAST